MGQKPNTYCIFKSQNGSWIPNSLWKVSLVLSLWMIINNHWSYILEEHFYRKKTNYDLYCYFSESIKHFRFWFHFINWHSKIIGMHSTTQLANRKHYIAPLSLIWSSSSFSVWKWISPSLHHLINHLLEINTTPVDVLWFLVLIIRQPTIHWDSQSSVRLYLVRSYRQHLLMAKLLRLFNFTEKWNWIDIHHFWPSQVQSGSQAAEGKQPNKKEWVRFFSAKTSQLYLLVGQKWY